MIVKEMRFVTMVIVLTHAELKFAAQMLTVKLDSILQNVLACLVTQEMLKLHVIFVSID
jgi:hypothetical protein